VMKCCSVSFWILSVVMVQEQGSPALVPGSPHRRKQRFRGLIIPNWPSTAISKPINSTIRFVTRHHDAFLESVDCLESTGHFQLHLMAVILASHLLPPESRTLYLLLYRLVHPEPFNLASSSTFCSFSKRQIPNSSRVARQTVGSYPNSLSKFWSPTQRSCATKISDCRAEFAGQVWQCKE
jgi:hypothetical protein